MFFSVILHIFSFEFITTLDSTKFLLRVFSYSNINPINVVTLIFVFVVNFFGEVSGTFQKSKSVFPIVIEQSFCHGSSHQLSAFGDICEKQGISFFLFVSFLTVQKRQALWFHLKGIDFESNVLEEASVSVALSLSESVPVYFWRTLWFVRIWFHPFVGVLRVRKL